MRGKIFVAVLAICLISTSTSLAVNLLVPNQYATIQAAIDNCNNEDVVIISPGIYTGLGNRDLDFAGRAITVCSTDPNDPCIVAVTIIDCNASSSNKHRGFYFNSGEDSNSVVDGLTIINGYALEGGGIYCYEYCSPTISNCIIRNNTTNGNFIWGGGGAIACHLHSSPKIINCVIKNNNVTNSGCGGGILCEYSSPVIKNCLISNNTAYYGGGIFTMFGCSPAISNCTIFDNEGVYGGDAVYAFASDYPVITNSILGDTSSGSDNLILIDAGLLGEEYSQLEISYSCVDGNQARISVAPGSTLHWGSGNIDSDPCFVTGFFGYHYLSQIAAGQASNSPCVDTGSDLAANLGMHIYTTRTDRKKDTGLVDMGYHYWINFADINGDGNVDFKDYAILASQWLLPPGNPSADIYPSGGGDEFVDYYDLAELVNYWRW